VAQSETSAFDPFSVKKVSNLGLIALLKKLASPQSLPRSLSLKM
jgi:hypothetical protein